MASRSRSSSASSDSSDTTMLDAPTHPLTPARPRNPSTTHTLPSTPAPAPDPSFSLLLSLPRELRDRVYTFALSSPYPFWWPNQAPTKHNVAVSLLQTSSQVYAETAPVLYTANKFLFTHPSDCNVFRVVASPHAEAMHSVYFRIREKDLRLWTTYLGSKSADRSLKHDLPNLKNLCIFMRCASVGAPRLLNHLGVHAFAAAPHPFGGVGPAGLPLAVHVQAVQQQVQHLTHALGPTGPPVIVPTAAHAGQHHPPPPDPQHDEDANADAEHQMPPPPPPPPPPPAMPFTAFAAGAVPHHHPLPPANAAAQPNHNILTTFLRFERELGIESLCLSLRDTLQDPSIETHQFSADARGGRREYREHRERTHTPPHRSAPEQDPSHHRRNAHDEKEKKRRDVPDVKIVCIMRVPKPEVSRLVRMYPEELSVDRNGDARTRFRKLHGADVCVEISGVDGVQG